MALDSPAGPLLTTQEAAEHCDVAPGTIRQWVARGYLQPVGRLPGGRQAVYLKADVERAEAKTKTKAGRGPNVDRLLAELERLGYVVA